MIVQFNEVKHIVTSAHIRYGSALYTRIRYRTRSLILFSEKLDSCSINPCLVLFYCDNSWLQTHTWHSGLNQVPSFNKGQQIKKNFRETVVLTTRVAIELKGFNKKALDRFRFFSVAWVPNTRRHETKRRFFTLTRNRHECSVDDFKVGVKLLRPPTHEDRNIKGVEFK